MRSSYHADGDTDVEPHLVVDQAGVQCLGHHGVVGHVLTGTLHKVVSAEFSRVCDDTDVVWVPPAPDSHIKIHTPVKQTLARSNFQIFKY